MLDDTTFNTFLESATNDEQEPEKTVTCKDCGHEVTLETLAIEPHQHTFRNPIGIAFDIVLFRDAPGAIDLGNATLVATWFPKCAWSFAMCAACKTHLGWWWQGAERFIGLISSRIIRL